VSKRWRSVRWLVAVIAAIAGLSILVAACGGDDDDDDGGGGGETAAEAAPKCGLGNGQQASGQPIRLGAIATKQPGTDFSEIPRTAQALFNCVNDNGGINGRPVELLIETEQTDPGQAANAAVKLAETDGVLGFVGNTSLIEGAVNHAYYEQNGFYVINSGIAPEAYSTPNMAAVNMGPRYSTDGAAQAVLGEDVDTVVHIQSNVPGTEYIEAGVRAVVEDAGAEYVGVVENVPIQDANSVALNVVQAAGDNGGIVMTFTPPEALKILQAAQQQALQDQAVWGCATPCNTDFLAEALGSEWNDKLLTNAEMRTTDHEGEDSQLYRDVIEEYASDVPLGSFSQFGFVQALIATEAMLGIQGEVTKESYNQAVLNVKNFQTDLLCAPWYFGEAPIHIPNNVDLTVVPQDGKMVQSEDCFPISDADPDIAAVRKIEQEDPSLTGG
jgi:branched-chain amino acid transport system substrate-binding protein